MTIRLAPLPAADERTLARAARRSAAIAVGNLAGYRMSGRTIPPAKGKGAPYRRHAKHTNA